MLRPATIEDAIALEPRLREADRVELAAAGYHDFLSPLTEGIELSAEAWAFEVNGTVHAIMGIAPFDGFASPWLLGSNELFDFKRQLCTLPHQFTPRWAQTYGLLKNYVHAENTQSIRWLRRMGFTIEAPIKLNGADFHPFTMRPPSV